MIAISAPNVEIVTTTETNATPAWPKSACIVSAAIRGDAAMLSTGLTYRYATLAAR